MSTLLDDIEAFNRKERYFLFTYAANGDSSFPLSAKFREELGGQLGIEIPADAKGYIDYHLDWIHAAVFLASRNAGDGPHDNLRPGAQKTGNPRDWQRVSTGNQEDIDLVVAFEQDGITWLVLVEAKGVGSWTNKQVQSKLRRLRNIDSDMTPEAKASIQLRLCLASPKESLGLVPEADTQWPEWMIHPVKKRPYWINLPVPGGRKKVTGCTETGTSANTREYWKVESVSSKDLVDGE